MRCDGARPRDGQDGAHASALRPFIANSPDGFLWMKMTMKTSTAIFASTAPGDAFEQLVEDAEAERGDDGAGELADAAEDDDQERVDDVALAEVGADVADLRERDAAEAGDAGAEREREHVDLRGVDADARRHAPVLRDAADEQAEARPARSATRRRRGRSRRTR